MTCVLGILQKHEREVWNGYDEDLPTYALNYVIL